MMGIRSALAIGLLAAAPLLMAASGQQVIDGYLQPAGYTQLTSLASAASLGTVPNGTKLTLIQAQGQPIRWRDDGVNPTSSVGMLLDAGQTLVYNGDPAAMRLIETASSAVVNVSFYR